MSADERKERGMPSNEYSELLAMWLLTFSQVYHQEILELAALAYRESLREFTSAQLDRGCRQALKECAFIPKPADIIRCIRETAPSYSALAMLAEGSQTEHELEMRRQIAAEARKKIPWLTEKKLPNETEITDEMRARAKQAAEEAMRRFGTPHGEAA